MRGARLWSIAWRNLWRNTRRTLLTLGAIAFGVFLAVLFTAMQDRSFSDMIDMAARLGGGHVVVQHEEYIDAPALTRTVEGTVAIRGAAERVPGVERAVDRIAGQAMLSSARHSTGIGFVAYDPARETEATLSFLEGVVEGEMLKPGDTVGAVLGDALADNLGVEVGDKVVYTVVDRQGEIVSGMARVRGMLSTGAASVDSGLMLLPIDRAREVLGYGAEEATQVAVFLADSRRSPRVADALGAGLPPGADALTWDVVMPDLSGFIAMKVGGSRFMELVIMVLVAASIFNTLFVSVMERTREFGIMRAIGYTSTQIFGLVMWESLWLALVGLGAAGVITVGPYLYLAQNGIDVSAQFGEDAMEVAGVGFETVIRVGIFPENVALIAAFAVVATLASGLYPAWRAGRVVPVEAIKLV